MARLPAPDGRRKKAIRLLAVLRVGDARKQKVGESYEIRRFNPFACQKECGGPGGELIQPVQAARRCTLPVFRGRWAPHDGWRNQQLWLCRVDPTGQDERLPEEPSEGCPGGWALSGFAHSVSKYLPMRGGQMPLVTPTTDSLILESVAHYLDCEGAAEARRERMLR